MKKYVKSSSDLLYFADYQVDNIGELVADNLTHMYRREGADFHYDFGQQGYDYDTGNYSITISCRVFSHYDPEINKNSRYGAYLDSMDGKTFTAKATFSYNRYDTQDTMGEQVVINLTDDIEDQIFKAVNGDVNACNDVKASTNLEPRQRTAVDGKSWWVVFDTDTQKYSTLTCFGKYNTKKDCQYAIDKYTKVGACDVKASTEPNEPNFDVMKLTDKMFTEAKEVADYLSTHNKNLTKKQDYLVMDLSDAVDSRSTSAVRQAIGELNNNTKGTNKTQEYMITDLYYKFNVSDGDYFGLGRNYAEDSVTGCDTVTGSTDITDDQVKFFYKGKFLGSCDPEYIECESLRDAMYSDTELSSLILEYLNSLGDPVFPVSEEDWGTPETDVSKIDIDDLYSTFMQELQFEYNDFPEDFYVDLSVPRSGKHTLEIFTGAVADDVKLG